jgi:hypothetical protein
MGVVRANDAHGKGREPTAGDAEERLEVAADARGAHRGAHGAAGDGLLEEQPHQHSGLHCLAWTISGWQALS